MMLRPALALVLVASGWGADFTYENTNSGDKPDAVDIPVTSAHRITGDFTACIAVSGPHQGGCCAPPGASQWVPFFGRRTSSTANHFALANDSGASSYQPWAYGSSGAVNAVNSAYASSGTDTNTFTWQRLCVVHDAGSTWTLYRDGVQAAQDATPGTPDDPNVGITIGYVSTCLYCDSEGYQEDARIYNVAPPLGNIEDMNGARGCDGQVEGLVGKWNMLDGTLGNMPATAGYILDSSPMAAHGTAVGVGSRPDFVPSTVNDCPRL